MRTPKPRISRSKNPVPKKVPERILGAKASLLDLPNELLLQVIEYLPCLDLRNFNQPTLVALSCTNRRLHALVESYLYDGYNSFFGNPYLFLRTMMINPEVAGKVHSLTLAYGTGVHEDRKIYNATIADRQSIKSGLKALNIPDWKTWATDCNDEATDQELLYTAVLMHTPNLTSLDIDDGEVPYQLPKWIELIRHCAGGNSFGRVHHFSQLKSIKVDIGILRLRHLIPLFRLHSLRSLTLVGLVETEETAQAGPPSFRWPVPAGSSSIEEVSLPDSFLHINILTTMLNTCRALKKLRYEHRDERWFYRRGRGSAYWFESEDGVSWTTNDVTTALLSYSKLSLALHRHSKSLTSLEVFDEVNDAVHNYANIGSLGMLRRMVRITYLKGPLGAFVEVTKGPHTHLNQDLPPSLKTFHVIIKWTDEEHACISVFEHMVIDLRHFLPELEELRIETEALRCSLDYNWDRIRKPLEAAGVKVIIEQRMDDVEDAEGGWEEEWAT